MTRRPGRLPAAAVGRAWRALCSKPRSRSYLALGVVLALGAPLGALVSRAVGVGLPPTFDWVKADVGRNPAAYACLTLSTILVFAVLGWALGRSFDRVRVLSITDPLTGLFNRRHFERRMAEEESRRLRHGHATCVLCVDIDGLKAINDGLGHRAGDRTIVAVGRILLGSVRAVDAVARVGGDEFAVLLPETSASQALVLARRIASHVVSHRDESIRGIAVSIGITELNTTGEDESVHALAAADAALYRAKAAGGGHIAVAGSLEPLASTSRHAAFMDGARLIDG